MWYRLCSSSELPILDENEDGVSVYFEPEPPAGRFGGELKAYARNSRTGRRTKVGFIYLSVDSAGSAQVELIRSDRPGVGGVLYAALKHVLVSRYPGVRELHAQVTSQGVLDLTSRHFGSPAQLVNPRTNQKYTGEAAMAHAKEVLPARSPMYRDRERSMDVIPMDSHLFVTHDLTPKDTP